MLASISRAEPPQPHITYLFPAGGQRGTTVQTTLTGLSFADARDVRITGQGVTATIAKIVDPTTVVLSVAIAPTSPLGERDLRIITPGGISNRFRFFVGEIPEINEVEPNDTFAQAQRLDSLPILVNGQVMEGDRDIFRFDAKAGETIVCHAAARALLPLIGDAVPGWNDAVLTLYDAKGHQLKSVDDFRFDPDPVLMYKIPVDGAYFIEIHDVLFRGRGDFLYRLSVGTLPFITDIFPLGAQQGATPRLALRGVNLPSDTLDLPLNGDGPAIRFVGVTGNGTVHSNLRPFAVSTTKEIFESEPNDTPATANAIETPIIVNGRIDHPGDLDYFKFSAKKGQKLVMEVRARRLESPLDAILTLFDAQMNKLAEEDDTVDPESPMITHHADPKLSYFFTAEGDYYLRLRDVQGKGGVEYAYRLEIAPPRPGFSLRVTPDNLRVAKGDSTVLNVAALRKDGFNGPIDLSVKDLPDGLVVSQGVIPANQDKALLTLTAPPDAKAAVFPLTVVGRASIEGAPVERNAIGAETLTQAFSYVQTLPTQELVLAVTDAGTFSLSADPSLTKINDLPPGGEMPVTVKIVRQPGIKVAVGVKAVGLPGYLTVKYTMIPADQDQATLTLIVAGHAPVGAVNNIVLSGTMRLFKKASEGEKGTYNVTRTLPAIPIRVIAETPATTEPTTQSSSQPVK